MSKASRFPKPGLRIFKTVLAVLICFLILSPFDFSTGFYAGIAAILCMQSDLQNSWPIGKFRIFGTFLGGTFSLIMMELSERLHLERQQQVFMLIIALSLLPLIYLVVLFKQNPATYITCVVYLSLVLSSSDRSPLAFATIRMGETLLGIFVSLGVNALPFLKRQSKEEQTAGI